MHEKKEVIVVATYREIAADLRREILEGRYRAGDTIPKITDLAAKYEAAYQTVRSAVAQLEQEGLVIAVRKRGTVVQAHPDHTRRAVRARQIERDELGYYSGPEVQHWRAIPHPDGERTRVIEAPVPMDIAEILGVEPGSPLTVRRRIVGDPRNAEHRQLADSWIAPWILEEIPTLAGGTGLGGMYDRVEEWAGHPLAWREEVSARIPTPTEAKALHMPPAGVPLLRIVRVTTLPDPGETTGGPAIEVQDIRWSAALFAAGYPLGRAPSATWPVTPATSDYYQAPAVETREEET
jgi:GntR family transcriptional regulator